MYMQTQSRHHASLLMRYLAVSISCIMIAICTGCAIHSTIVMEHDHSGTFTMETELAPFLLQYLADIVGADAPTLRAIRLIDEEDVAMRLRAESGLYDIRVDIVGADRLQIAGNFDTIVRLVKAQPQLAALTVDDDIYTLAITITPEYVRHFLYIGGGSESIAGSFLLPIEPTMSEEEYRDYIGWALEEYEAAPRLERTVDASAIEIIFRVDGTIVSQQGGVRGDDHVLFRIPLVRLLTLREPLYYRVRYRISPQ